MVVLRFATDILSGRSATEEVRKALELGRVPNRLCAASLTLLLALSTLCAPAGPRQEDLSPPLGSEAQSESSHRSQDSLSGRNFFVAPGGGPGGDGSQTSPWDLQAALNQPSSVKPGDTIWLRGGTYAGTFSSRLTGTASAPIVVRQYPGERATLDGGNSNQTNILTVSGSYTWYWGFEIMSSDPNRQSAYSGGAPPDIGRGGGIATVQDSTTGPGLKFINLIIHDTAGGYGLWKEAIDSEIYGNLIYYNGFDATDRGHGHGIYTQNGTGTKHITDNILFSGFAYNIHAYGETAPLNNLDMEGNTTFNAGDLSLVSGGDQLLLGGLVVANNPIISNNFTYGDAKFRLGYSAGCSNATVTNNYVANVTQFVSCLPVTMTGNTFYGSITGFSPSSYPSNTYTTSRPTGIRMFIRPNVYEPGRANITVFNWDLASTVNVDLSSVLQPGSQYEIRNAQNYFAAPVATGTYTGGTVSIPMTDLSVASPVGWTAPPPTGPEFNAFVLLTNRFGRMPVQRSRALPPGTRNVERTPQ